MRLEDTFPTYSGDGMDKNDYIIQELCLLVDRLVKDLLDVEVECITARKEWAKRLPDQERICLEHELFSNLASSYEDDLAYQFYLHQLDYKKDPLESLENIEFLD